MSRLGEILEDEMPIDRVVANCGECGEEFFDTMKEVSVSPLIAGNTIDSMAKSHREKTGHDDLQVSIDKLTPVKEIEATITVNE